MARRGERHSRGRAVLVPAEPASLIEQHEEVVRREQLFTSRVQVGGAALRGPLARRRAGRPAQRTGQRVCLMTYW